jgi:putative oxidoreductase
LLLGCCTRLGTLALIVFLIPATVIFHDFWSVEGPEQQLQMAHFMKNLAILGGLLVVVGLGPGGLRFSRQKRRTRNGSGDS